MTDTPDAPDFTLSHGDGANALIRVPRSCWKMDVITTPEGKPIQLVRIEPPIEEGARLPPDAMLDVLGLVSRNARVPLERFGLEETCGAIVWLVRPAGDSYAPLSSIDLILVRKVNSA